MLSRGSSFADIAIKRLFLCFCLMLLSIHLQQQALLDWLADAPSSTSQTANPPFRRRLTQLKDLGLLLLIGGG